MKKWLIKKINRRLSNVEGHRITAKERKIKRTIRWTILAVLAWVTPFTYEYTEHIVIENVYAADRGKPESVEDARISIDTAEDGGRVGEEDGESVESMIRKAFPDNPDEAIKVAKCESNLNPDRIGDLHLPVEIDGETLGYSYGLFQIRSGGKDPGGAWSRPAKEGMTLNEWAKKMLDAKENIKEAKKIYDKGGWGPWACKKALIVVK